MYQYIKGFISAIYTNGVVIDNNWIGYFIKTPNPYNFILQEEITIYTYLHVREDVFDLYGFKSLAEKDFFIKLISVKGLGPKGALAILASGDLARLEQAILASDIHFLQKFPGIGPKASSQIILDLQGKLTLNQLPISDPKVKNVKEALKNLGYSNSELKRLDSFLQKNLNLSIEELIKAALKQL